MSNNTGFTRQDPLIVFFNSQNNICTSFETHDLLDPSSSCVAGWSLRALRARPLTCMEDRPIETSEQIRQWHQGRDLSPSGDYKSKERSKVKEGCCRTIRRVHCKDKPIPGSIVTYHIYNLPFHRLNHRIIEC